MQGKSPLIELLLFVFARSTCNLFVYYLGQLLVSKYDNHTTFQQSHGESDLFTKKDCFTLNIQYA